MTQVSAGIGVNLFVNPVTDVFGISLIRTEPDGGKVVDLKGHDFVVPVYVHPSVQCRERRGGMDNSPRRKLAKYLLHNITSLEAILDVVQGKSFQRGDVILSKCYLSSLPGGGRGRNLICKSIN